jgi:hypothetical protein
VSDTTPSTHPPLPYAVADIPDVPPVILWGIVPPKPQPPPEGLRQTLKNRLFTTAMPRANGDGKHEEEGAKS